MSRERKGDPFKRISEIREPKKVFLLACEGRHTERKYFLGLKTMREPIQILEYIEIQIFQKNNPDISNPLKIFNELKANIQENGIEANEVCLIVDRDSKSFTEEQYAIVLKGCQENRFNLYLSNPNFELWLLFHFLQKKLSFQEEIKFLSQQGEVAKELQSYLVNSGFSRATKFNKKISFSHYADKILNAIFIAKKHETNIYKLKDNLGTNVYSLLEDIIKVESIIKK